MFSLDNLAIQYPHAIKERVSAGTSLVETTATSLVLSLKSEILGISLGWNIGYAGGLPVLILVLWVLLFRPEGHKIHVTFLGFFIRRVPPDSKPTSENRLPNHTAVCY